MTQEQIDQKAEEFEFTDGIYGFKQGVKWILKQLDIKNEESGVSVNLYSYTVANNGSILRLPRKMVRMIHYFIMNRNKVITRDELLRNCWEDGVVVGERTIDVHVRKIKIALKNDNIIQTVKGIGYKWTE